jgi:anion-transporting  ArsA/GET3 family ATPase
VWVDDDHGEVAQAWAAARSGPTLLVPTDPAVGLTDAMVVDLEAWASRQRTAAG